MHDARIKRFVLFESKDSFLSCNILFRYWTKYFRGDSSFVKMLRSVEKILVGKELKVYAMAIILYLSS